MSVTCTYLNACNAAHAVNNMKGSIYMVFDYMDHDLTGLMERMKYRLEPGHVSVIDGNPIPTGHCSVETLARRNFGAEDVARGNPQQQT